MSETSFDERVRVRSYFLSQRFPEKDSETNYLNAVNEERRQDQIRQENPICVICQSREYNKCDWKVLACHANHYMHDFCQPESRAYCPECLSNDRQVKLIELV